MKYARLSTTSKIYLLTLLLIFGILFLNQSAYGKSDGQNTKSEKRLKLMERYLSWIDSGEYGSYKQELGNRALVQFKGFLQSRIPEDTGCLTQTYSTPNSFMQNIRNFFSNLIPKDELTLASKEVQQLSECKAKIKADYKQAKKYNRLLKYLQVEEGKPNVCVKADLGIGAALKARGFNPVKVNSKNPKETGRTKNLPVYLCTGNDGKKKVRVLDDSGTRLKLAPEDATRSALMVENLPPQGSLDKLIEKLGLK